MQLVLASSELVNVLNTSVVRNSGNARFGGSVIFAFVSKVVSSCVLQQPLPCGQVWHLSETLLMYRHTLAGEGAFFLQNMKRKNRSGTCNLYFIKSQDIIYIGQFENETVQALLNSKIT